MSIQSDRLPVCIKIVGKILYFVFSSLPCEVSRLTVVLPAHAVDNFLGERYPFSKTVLTVTVQW